MCMLYTLECMRMLYLLQYLGVIHTGMCQVEPGNLAVTCSTSESPDYCMSTLRLGSLVGYTYIKKTSN